MLHYHVVAKPVSLIPILPIVHVVIESLLVQSIHVNTVAIAKRIRLGSLVIFSSLTWSSLSIDESKEQ